MDNFEQKEKEDIKEISRIQRYLDRPSLEEIFAQDVMKNKEEMSRCIIEAINKYGYYQSDIARFLNVHCSTISRIARRESR